MESAIDIVINIERTADGKRKITNISEVVGIKDGEIILKPIFEFIQHGITSTGEVDGEFVLNKNKPKVLDKINSRGITDINDIFKK